MWWQGKAMLLCGFQLFNRRQDFPRFQPCDLRFDAEGMRVLIRYAKNDLRGSPHWQQCQMSREAAQGQ